MSRVQYDFIKRTQVKLNNNVKCANLILTYPTPIYGSKLSKKQPTCDEYKILFPLLIQLHVKVLGWVFYVRIYQFYYHDYSFDSLSRKG